MKMNIAGIQPEGASTTANGQKSSFNGYLNRSNVNSTQVPSIQSTVAQTPRDEVVMQISDSNS